MKPCRHCGQPNSDDALYCHQCGGRFPLEEGTIEPSAADVGPTSAAAAEETELWRAFIGPNADHYLAAFRKFSDGPAPHFALTWHWPAFLFLPFLWFLYRKMYAYALVYAVGPAISALLFSDPTVGIVWSIGAGVSANYVYFWHVKEQVGQIRAQAGSDIAGRDRLLRDLGGVQPYVIWVGVAFYAVFLAMVIEMIRMGPPEGREAPGKPPPAGAARRLG